MASREKTTLGIALVVVVIGHASWVALSLGIFLIVWGRDTRRTESFIRRFPGGKYAVKVLEQIDLFLSQRDRDYDRHIRATVIGYDNDMRKSLQELWRMRNTSRILPQHLNQFTVDGLIEYPHHNGPGSIRSELRDIIGRALDELGA